MEPDYIYMHRQHLPFPRWRKAYSAHITARKKTGLTAASAGLYTENGLPASANRGYRSRRTRARIFSAHRFASADRRDGRNAKYLVCMTGSHYDRLCELFPDCADKIFTLLPEDISDPFGGDLAYRRSAAEDRQGACRRSSEPGADEHCRDAGAPSRGAGGDRARVLSRAVEREHAARGAGQGHFLVAEQDGRTAGYVGCQTVLDEGYITNVAVSPDFRRQGIARALIAELTAEKPEKQAGVC